MRDFSRAARARLAGQRLSAAREADVVEELTQHLEDRYDELVHGGADPAAAEVQVLRELAADEPGASWLRRPRDAGDAEVVAGGGAGGGLLRGLMADGVFAVRMLRRDAVFATAALIAIGLGTGAATAVFSLLDGVVLRPLPYAQPERLVSITEANALDGLREQQMSPVTFLDHRASGVFEDAAAWWVPQMILTDEVGEPIRVNTVGTSTNLFNVLGVAPQRGRSFDVDSTLYGSAQQVVISDLLWRGRFSGREDVIGTTIALNGFPHEVIGVMPPGFVFPDETDVWQGLTWDMSQHSRAARFMGAVGRLSGDVTVAQANATLAGVAERLSREFAPTNRNWSAEVETLSADVAGVFRPALFALFAAAGLLLLIGCINVANLLLARASVREAELAVRGALGATRGRLVRQLLVESVILATLGGALGFGVATIAVRSFLAWSPIEIPRAAGIGIDLRVLAFAICASFVTALLFGLVPALRGSRAELLSVLRRAARTGGSGAGPKARTALVVTEVALSVALLCCAGLLIRTMATLSRQDAGVSHEDAIVVDVQLPEAEYDFRRTAAFYSVLITDLRAEPRVSAAGAANFLPLDAGWRMSFHIPGTAVVADAPTLAQHHTVDEGWFDAVGARIVSGRGFTEHDDTTRPGALIVNEAFARRYFAGENPVGRPMRSNADVVGPMGLRLLSSDDHEIVGVVSDIRNLSLTDPAEPAIYWSNRQFPFRKMYIAVRGAGPQAELAGVVREAVRRHDPGLPIGEVRTMARVLESPADPTRLVMLVMTVFAALALMLALTGIYGVLSYMIDQRQREFGIRLALGATPGGVRGMVVRNAIAVGVLGTAVGLMMTVAASRLLSRLLFGVTAVDPLALGLAAAVVLVSVLAVAAGPARRASLVDPMRSLRE